MNANDTPIPVAAEEGLKRLVDGNERFLNGTVRFPFIRNDVLAALAHEQRPYATKRAVFEISTGRVRFPEQV